MGFHHISWSNGPAAASHIEHLDERLGAGFTLTHRADEDVRVWFDLRTGTVDASGPAGERHDRCSSQVTRALPRLQAYRLKKLAAMEAPDWGERLELTLEARQAYWQAVVVLKHILPGYCPRTDLSIPPSARDVESDLGDGVHEVHTTIDEPEAGISEPGAADRELPQTPDLPQTKQARRRGPRG